MKLKVRSSFVRTILTTGLLILAGAWARLDAQSAPPPSIDIPVTPVNSQPYMIDLSVPLAILNATAGSNDGASPVGQPPSSPPPAASDPGSTSSTPPSVPPPPGPGGVIPPAVDTAHPPTGGPGGVLGFLHDFFIGNPQSPPDFPNIPTTQPQPSAAALQQQLETQLPQVQQIASQVNHLDPLGNNMTLVQNAQSLFNHVVNAGISGQLFPGGLNLNPPSGHTPPPHR